MSKAKVHIRVEFFGEFSVIGNNRRITERARKSSKVWKLIQYLFIHKDRSVPQEELLEVFCSDQAESNHGSVMRTMIYRARSALEKGGLKNADNLIVAKSGGYSLNKDVIYTTDIGEFEEYLKQAGDETLEDSKKLELLMKGISLYTGDFLPNSSGELWVLPSTSLYRSLYLEAVHKALEILESLEKTTEILELCVRALKIDPFDVQLIKYNLKSLLKQGKNIEALDFYKKMEIMLFDVLGVSFSDDLKEIYHEIVKPEVKVDLSLDDVLDDWTEGAEHFGGFYCELSVFKIMYQIEARSKQRYGRSTFAVRFDTEAASVEEKPIDVMKQLGVALAKNLRMGDVFTRYSPRQYMFMVYNITYDDCKKLIARIMNSIDARYLTEIKKTSISQINAIPGKDATHRYK